MIYITGDTHGDIERFNDKALKKLTAEDLLIICGDFGFIWQGGENERKHLKTLAKKKYTIAFVDGSHENFGRLRSFAQEQWNGGTIHRIANNVIHLMRGQYYTIGGTSFFTMGGGDSDESEITGEEAWTGGSLPDKSELVMGAANLDLRGSKVDVIISHEPSSKIKSILSDQDTLGTMARINALNAFLEQLSQNVEYKKWFFGSFHIDKRITSKITAVYTDIIPLDI
ncbi:MAG: metallophosphoesterase [Clostridia bacterium]|nr:metallophosphoesterase [Clostridia bacterium]